MLPCAVIEIGTPEWRRLAENQRQLALAEKDPKDRELLLAIWLAYFGIQNAAYRASIEKYGLHPDPPDRVGDIPGDI